MFRSVALFLTIALVAWLMPLGAFIKKTEEKTACGGKRAFHMCSMMQESQPAQKGPSDGVVKFTNASGSVNKGQLSQGGGSEFLTSDLVFASQDLSDGFREMNAVIPHRVIVHPFEHVPIV